MNAIELLEALLRGPASGQPAGEAQPASRPQATPQPTGGENRGAQILRDILSGGQAEQAPPPAARPQPTGSRFPTEVGAEYEKTDVKELLRDAKEREAAAASGRPVRTRPAAPAGWPGGEADVRRAPAPAPAPPREEEAAVLIRAMINATRADGRMDRDEEKKLLRQLGQPSPEAMAFIRAEFQKPLDVREFAWSVPLGLEEKVYAISLSVLDVDQREESDYLNQLAHGLRLSPETCAQFHQQFGASVLR